jgi:hypothetical protein
MDRIARTLGKGRRRACALGAVAVLAAACSRTGSITGDIVVATASGSEQRGAYVSIIVVRATEAFEQEWRGAVAAFERELGPARRTRDEAARLLEDARMAWSKAVGMTPAGGRRTHGALASGRQRELWAAVRAGESRLAAAESRMREIGRKHDPLAAAVVEKHAAGRVETDASGNFVLAGLPAGPVHLYSRMTVGKRTFVWFRPVTVWGRMERMNLTAANAGGWPLLW